MKRILSLFLVAIMALSCITPVYATETDTTESTEDTRIQVSLPELPDLQFEEPYPNQYNIRKFVLKIGSVYYAFVLEFDIGNDDSVPLYVRSSDTGSTEYGSDGNSLRYLYVNNFFLRYVESYQLVDGAWVLIYETGADNVSGLASSEQKLIQDYVITYSDWIYAWTYYELAVYSTHPIITMKSSSTSASYIHNDVPEDYYNVSFTTDSSSGSGDDSDSSSGSTNTSWSDEDKTTLGGWFQSVLNKLSDVASSIVSSIGNFIDSSVSSISGFINSAVSSISDFFDNLGSTITTFADNVSVWIENARVKIEEFFAGIWSSVQDWWTNTVSSWWNDIIEAVKTWWSELWQPAQDWFTAQKEEAEAITEAFTSFFDSIIMLFEAVFDYSYEDSGGGEDGTACTY